MNDRTTVGHQLRRNNLDNLLLIICAACLIFKLFPGIKAQCFLLQSQIISDFLQHESTSPRIELWHIDCCFREGSDRESSRSSYRMSLVREPQFRLCSGRRLRVGLILKAGSGPLQKEK
jgi:hypothetical protein